MSGRDVVVIGASAGGVDALKELCSTLPPDLPAAVCIVLHLPEEGRSILPSILQRQTQLLVKDAEDGDRLRPGTIYVAVPGRHLVVENDHVALTQGPPENRS